MKKYLQLELLKNNLQQQYKYAQMEIEKLKEAEKIFTSALNKYFTPGQVKMLMSQKINPCVRWSPAEDIVSAIALRSH